jgi:hypothetical protein
MRFAWNTKAAPPAIWVGDQRMHKGNLINDLWNAVDTAAEKSKSAAEKGAKHSSPEPQAAACNNSHNKKEDLKPE